MTNEITKLKAEVDRLQAKNTDLKEKLCYMEAKCKVLNVRWMEAQERLIDYQKMLRVINAQRAMEAWFNDEDEDE